MGAHRQYLENNNIDWNFISSSFLLRIRHQTIGMFQSMDSTTPTACSWSRVGNEWKIIHSDGKYPLHSLRILIGSTFRSLKKDGIHFS